MNNKEENKKIADHPFLALIELYACHIDISSKTKRSYESILKQFAYYLQANNVMTPKRQDIIKYRDHMIQIGQTANTIQKTILVIKSFYRFLKMNYQQYDLDPSYIYDITEGIRSVRVSKRLKRLPLTLEQAQILLKTAKENCINISGYRNYAIILLMITTGLRGIEIIRAKKKDLAKMGNISILFVQGKGRQEADEFVKISQVVTKAFNDYCIICAVSKENHDFLIEIDRMSEVTHFHLEELNEEETSKYVRYVAKEIGLPLSGNLETLLVMPTLKELRTPFMIRLILTSINNESRYTDNDYNIIDIFEIMENFLSKQNSKVNEAVEYLFGIVLRKKINRFSHLEVKHYEDEVDYLYNQGIIKKTNTGFTITNQEYYLYRVALAMMNEYGLSATLETFKMFESAIPYYIYLIYLETDVFDDTLILSLSDELKEKMISLFLSEKLPFELLVSNKHYHKNMDSLLSRFRNSGLYPLARYMIQTIENLGIESNELLDYTSEKIMIHYNETGQLLDVKTELFKSIYHIGYVYYCIDEPFKALEYYQKAYDIMVKSKAYNVSFMFDYIDTLLDIGDNDKIKELIQEAVERCDNKTDEFIIHYNLTLGMIAVDDLAFGLAEEYFKMSLSTALKVFNLKRIQISYGELGRLYIYQARYEEALDYLNRNLEIAKSVSDFNGMAIASKMIALTNLLQGRHLDAYRYFGYAENYAEQIRNYWRLYKTRLYLDLMDDKRHHKYERDINDACNMKSIVFQATALPMVALLYMKQGNISRAEEFINKAESCATAVSNKRYLEVTKIIRSVIVSTDDVYVSTALTYQSDLIALVNKLVNHTNSIDFSLPLSNYQYRGLNGNRIDLKPMDVKYAEDIFEYTSSKTSTRYVMWDRHEDIKDTLSFIDYVYDVRNAGYSMTWAIYHKADEKVIGTIDLNYRDNYENVEVGYILNSKYWHYCFATEALQMVIEYSNLLTYKMLIWCRYDREYVIC